MKTGLDYLKEMFVPVFGEQLSDDEAAALLAGNSDESKLFKAFLAAIDEQGKELKAENERLLNLITEIKRLKDSANNTEELFPLLQFISNNL